VKGEGHLVSLVKQIIAAVFILLLVAGGFVAYERMASGETTAGPSQRADGGGVPVQLASAELRRAERRVEAVGSTMSRRAIEIVPEANGRITEIAFEPGETVSAGDVLVRLDDDIERANLTEAEAALREAELALERGRTLRQSNTITQASMEQLISQEAAARAGLERARRRLADREIRAPFDGIVGLRRVDLGARVTDSTVITTLDDRSEIEIEFSLPETLYGAVRSGQPVVATTVAFPDEHFEGGITDIDSRIDQTSRSFKVRARLPNPEQLLPAGMFMHITVVLEAHDVVMVPEESILAEGNQTYVFVADNDHAARRVVRLGQREVGYVEIVEGLEAGEDVIVQGTQRLREGAPLRVLETVADPEEDADEPVSATGPA
jgi:membrane fusion protein, multidrug efflux system